MAMKLIPDIDRLFKRVEITIDSCWIWTGALDKDGYAVQMKVGSYTDGTRRAERPHRFAYERFFSPIPEGYTIDHLCRRRCCVNPAHMEPVTSRVNTQRGWRKNKQFCKNGHPLFGDNLKMTAGRWPQRVCRTCARFWTKQNEIKTNGASQKKYAAKNREKRRADQAARRAAWTPEQREQKLAYSRMYDATRRVRKK